MLEDTIIVVAGGVGVTYHLTAVLRWRNGILEQMWQGSDGTQKWYPVPTADDKPKT